MSDKWMTVKDVADYLQLSTDQIYRLAQQGRIPVSKVGNLWRFKRERIDQWMEGQEVSNRQPTTGTQKRIVRRYSDPVAQEAHQLTKLHEESGNH
jgi:excisionase family DNA binding protein